MLYQHLAAGSQRIIAHHGCINLPAGNLQPSFQKIQSSGDFAGSCHSAEEPVAAMVQNRHYASMKIIDPSDSGVLVEFDSV